MSETVPGELITSDGSVQINVGRKTTEATVENTGDRPVQVGSHFHFFEVNPMLKFDREASYGMRLNIPAGTSVRFEPGVEREVTLVSIGGNRTVHGMAGLVEGNLDDKKIKAKAVERAQKQGYID